MCMKIIRVLMMNIENKSGFFLILWIVGLILIGSIIGSLTTSEITTWYSVLNRSLLTPPNYVFPIVWTILYAALGAAGWSIWRSSSFSQIKTIKALYLIQLMLNWSWTPLFFHYHLTEVSLIILGAMDILVGTLIGFSYRKVRLGSILMIPYLAWILLATYLNFYIWWYN